MEDNGIHLGWLSALLDRMWDLTFRRREDIIIQLGVGELSPGRPAAVISPRAIWQKQPIRAKVRALLARSWTPSSTELAAATDTILRQQLFGGDEDFGPQLLRLCVWRGNRSWEPVSSLEQDETRARALDAHGEVCRRQFARAVVSGLNLRLATRDPALCWLVYPMTAKVPVITMRYFIGIDAQYAFGAVRTAAHPRSDQVVAYLYDLLFLQQKTALALLDFAVHVRHAEEQKGDAVLIASELRGILLADLVIAYLKASIEKTLALVAETHGILNLDSMKTHAAKLRALQRLPSVATQTAYGTLLLDLVQADELQELNDYRAGVFHKKGICGLQPHSMFSLRAESIPLQRFFEFMCEQHRKNSAAFLAALALLADELVRRSPIPDAVAVRNQLSALIGEAKSLQADYELVRQGAAIALRPDSS
jgi:hypothetical protein